MQTNNTVVIIGRIATQIEVKQTNGGIAVVEFTVAVPRLKDDTDFIICQAWRNTAEFIGKYFEKGKPVVCLGSIRNQQWTTKDGEKRYKTFVEVNEVGFTPKTGEDQTKSEPTLHEVNDEDIPF